MAISNLLKLTLRRNLHYEPEVNQIKELVANRLSVSNGTNNVNNNSICNTCVKEQQDSIIINGKTVNLFGNATDKQIEEIYKVGYEKAVSDMIEVITTCKDITDTELTEIIGQTNPTGVPQTLRIIRDPRAEEANRTTKELANKAETSANNAYDKLIEAQNNWKTAQTEKNNADSAGDEETQIAKEAAAKQAAQDAIAAANKAKSEAQTARTNIQKVRTAGTPQVAVDKAQVAEDVLDGKTSGKEIYKLNVVTDEGDNTQLQEADALETAAQEVLDEADKILKAIELNESIRNANNLAEQARQAAANADSNQGTNDEQAASDAANARNLAEQARQAAQRAIELAENASDPAAARAAAEKATSLANAAEAMAYAVDATIAIYKAQDTFNEAVSESDVEKAKDAVRNAKSAVTAAEKARQAAVLVTNATNKTTETETMNTAALNRINGITGVKLLDGTTIDTVEVAADEIYAEIRSNFPTVNPDDVDAEEEEEQQPEEPISENGEMLSEIPNSTDYQLIRKGSSSEKKVTVTATPDGVTLRADSFYYNSSASGNVVYYKITSLTGSNVTATFEILDNGRIVIQGNDIKVVAYKGQKDDLMIIGHNNEIHTGDGADLVRLGISVDASGVESNKNESYTGTTPILTALKNACSGNVFNNKVYLGDGDDYIYDYTNHQGGGANTIYGGSGTDAYRNTWSIINAFTETNIYDDKIEEVYTDLNKSTNIEDGKYTIESYGQGGIGDCRFMAFLSSLRLSSNNLSQYGIEIKKSGSNYTVTFNKFKTAPKYSGENNNYSLTFSESDIWNGSTPIWASGDLTVRLVEYAMNELIKKNMPTYTQRDDNGDVINPAAKHDLSTTSWEDYARYFYGNDTFSWQPNVDVTASTKMSDYYGSNVLEDVFTAESAAQIRAAGYNTVDDFYAGYYHLNNALEYYQKEGIFTLDELWTKYQAGQLSNLCCGTYSDSRGFSDELTICSMHAYAITDVTSTYVEVINPWDSQDRLRLERADFFKYFVQLTSVGSSMLEIDPNSESWNTTITNNNKLIDAGITTNSQSGEILVEFKENTYYYYNKANNTSEQTEQVPDLNIEEEPTIYDEIDEITQSIEAVKEVLEQEKKFELFS